MGRSTQFVVLLAAGFLLIFGSLAFAIFRQRSQNNEIEQEIKDLKAQIQIKQAKTSKHVAKEAEKAEINSIFGQIVGFLPIESPRQQDIIVEQLNGYASYHDLKFQQIVVDPEEKGKKAAPKKAKGKAAGKSDFGDSFQRVGVAIQYRGTFANFLKFLNDVERNPSFLRVDQISLKPIRGEQDPILLDITIRLSTFQYVVKR
jgi:Tfp pilus assembly protein PilO